MSEPVFAAFCDSSAFVLVAVSTPLFRPVTERSILAAWGGVAVVVIDMRTLLDGSGPMQAHPKDCCIAATRFYARRTRRSRQFVRRSMVRPGWTFQVLVEHTRNQPTARPPDRWGRPADPT